MSRRIYPHRRVRYWYTYDIEEICSLYSEYKLHPQTIRKWVKCGLKTIDTSKPTLIYGYDLIQYLKQNNTANKCHTAFDEMFCMACQDARPIFQNRIAVDQKAQFMKAHGVCRECKNRMCKSYKLLDLAQLRTKFMLVGVSELYDDAIPTGKTHIQAQRTVPTNESLQGELF